MPLVAAVPNEGTDPHDRPLRTHERLENGLPCELTGLDDEASPTLRPGDHYARARLA
jgi:hypothetical protein